MKYLAKPSVLFAVALVSLASWMAFHGFSPRSESHTADQPTNHRLRPPARVLGPDPQSSPSDPANTILPSNTHADQSLEMFSSFHHVMETHPRAAGPTIHSADAHSGPSSASILRRSAPRESSASHSADGSVRPYTPAILGRPAPRNPLSPNPGPYETPQPAAWVDLGDLALPDASRDAALQTEAERLLPLLTTLDSQSETPTSFSARREAVDASDHWFRQRYGGWLWAQHHIHAHHLAAGAQK